MCLHKSLCVEECVCVLGGGFAASAQFALVSGVREMATPAAIERPLCRLGPEACLCGLVGVEMSISSWRLLKRRSLSRSLRRLLKWASGKPRSKHCCFWPQSAAAAQHCAHSHAAHSCRQRARIHEGRSLPPMIRPTSAAKKDDQMSSRGASLAEPAGAHFTVLWRRVASRGWAANRNGPERVRLRAEWMLSNAIQCSMLYAEWWIVDSG